MPKVTKASRRAKQTVIKWENKENDTIELTDGSDDDRARPAPRPLHAKKTAVKLENDTIELTDGSDDDRARPAPRPLHAKKTAVKLENDTIELTDGSDDDRARPAPRALNHTIRSVIYPFDKLDPIVFRFSGPVEVVKVRLLLLFHPNFL